MSDTPSKAPQPEQHPKAAKNTDAPSELSIEELESVAGGDGDGGDDLAGNVTCPTGNAYKCSGLV